MFLAADTVVLALRALSFVAIFQAVGNALFLDLFGARLSAAVDERVRTLARIAGHSSIAMSTRYVHPSEDAVLAAVERLGGHRIGHSCQPAELSAAAPQSLTQ